LYGELVGEAREAIIAGNYAAFREQNLVRLGA
jgi:hypothetical protein